MINARLSDRTFARLSNSSLARKLLLPKGIEILTTSERQRSRWLEIGVPRDRVEVTGNLKVDALTLNDRNPFDSKTLRHQFGFPENSFVLTGISTWEGEEEMLVDVLKELRKKKIAAHLLLIPRHAERRGNVAAMLSQKVAHYHLRTQSVQAPHGTLGYLADTTGELSSLIQCSDLAFCGKTLPPHRGGQNPIEPVSLGIPLVLGPNFQNFRQTCKDLLVHQAVLTAESLQGVKSALLSLAQSQSKRIQLRQHALAWMDAQGSPSVRTLEKIHLLLSHPSK